MPKEEPTSGSESFVDACDRARFDLNEAIEYMILQYPNKAREYLDLAQRRLVDARSALDKIER